LVAVAGDPRAGKTTFCEDFLASLSPEAAWVATGHCSEQLRETEPYVPIIECLDAMARSNAEAVRLHEKAPLWSQFVLGCAIGDAPHGAPAASKERMRRELVHLLEDLSRVKPVLLFIDAQWADESTCEMLQHLATAALALRVLLLAAYRPGDDDAQGTRHPFQSVRLRWSRLEACEEWEVPPLSRDDVAAYLRLLLPASEIPQQLARAVHERTEGNALFMVDLVRFLRDQGFLVPQNGRWELVRPVQNIETLVPRGARETVTRRDRGKCRPSPVSQQTPEGNPVGSRS
jgi:hypothetical protein